MQTLRAALARQPRTNWSVSNLKPLKVAQLAHVDLFMDTSLHRYPISLSLSLSFIRCLPL